MSAKDIERLAGVLQVAVQGHADFGTFMDFHEMARLVLQALREPSEEARRVGMLHIGGDQSKYHEDARLVWQAMIDYLLAE